MAIDYSVAKTMSIVDVAKQALKKPEDFGYWGNPDMFKSWGFTGVDQTGMFDILERANFKAITEDLIAKYPDDFRIEHYNHWATGWVERLTCRVLLHKDKAIIDENISAAFRAVMNIHEMLDNYPIYDEDVYYEIVGEETVKIVTEMPRYLLDMVDEENDFWVDKIIQKLDEMNVYLDPVAQCYPTDNEFLTAVYECELWNPENIDSWQEWCYENEKEFPPRKLNVNQLELFED